jgi:hypothetical protein
LPAVKRSMSSSSHFHGCLCPPLDRCSREAFESKANFSRGFHLTSSTKACPKGGEEYCCSQHQRSCLLSHVLVVACCHRAFDCSRKLVAHVDSSRFRFFKLRFPSLDGESDCVPRSEPLLLDDDGARAATCAASKRT